MAEIVLEQNKWNKNSKMGWTCWEWILDLTQSGGRGYGGQMSKWDMVKEGKILKWEEDKPKILRVFPFSRKDLKIKILQKLDKVKSSQDQKSKLRRVSKYFPWKFWEGEV